MHQKHKYYNTK